MGSNSDEQTDVDAHMEGVYLLHFERKLAHSQHYLGWSNDVAARVYKHAKGNGARLPAVFREQGIGFVLARVWEGGDRTLERRLKRQRNAPKLCPVCRGARKE